MHCHHVDSVLCSLVGDNPASHTNASIFRLLLVHSMSCSHDIHVLNLMSRLNVPRCFRFFVYHVICFNGGCKRRAGHSWVTFTFSMFRSAAAPLRQLWSHTLEQQHHPPPPSPPKCLPAHPTPYAFEDTRICNRKDNPPLWSARNGFFLMFISNYKLFSYSRFTFSVSAGQIYFFR